MSDVGRNALAETGAWITGMGGKLEHAGDGLMTLDRDVNQYGFAAGYSGEMTSGVKFGVMGGYIRSEQEIASQWASSYGTESDGWFIGANGAHNLGKLTLEAGVTAGRMSTDQSRFVNDNLAETNGLTLGESWANASYGSWFLAPEIGVSATFGQADGWSLTPAARLRYSSQWSEGFTETGSNANAMVDDRKLGLLEANAEIAVTKAYAFGAVTTRLGYQTRQSTGDDAATVTLLDITDEVGFGSTDGQAGYAGLGLDLSLAPNAQLGLNVTGYFGEDTVGAQATARLSAAF